MRTGHEAWTYDFGTPRQFTKHGGWQVRCECGHLLGDLGDYVEVDVNYDKHLDEVVALLASQDPLRAEGWRGKLSALWKMLVD